MTKTSNADLSRTPWLAGRVPDGFWDVAENRLRYLEWLGERCGFRTTEDWYRVSKRHFYAHRGGGLLANYFRDSPFAAVQEYRPDYPWKAWLFRSVPQCFWQDVENRRAYMNWLGKLLGFRKASDWYAITKKDFYAHGGGGLLGNYYGDSPLAAMREYKPRYPWKAWLFKSVPQGFWKRSRNRSLYMEWLGRQLCCRRPEDWYRIQRKHFLRHGGGGLLVMYYADSPLKALQEFQPEVAWDPNRFVTGRA